MPSTGHGRGQTWTGAAMVVEGGALPLTTRALELVLFHHCEYTIREYSRNQP